ncbi:MAG: peptidoglycan-binding protein [Salaquimonas sp.]
MSRIRSQLDTILAGNTGHGQTHSAPPAMAPRRAFEAQPHPAPIHQPVATAAPSRDITALQHSLDQLSQRINAIPKQQAQSVQQSNSALQNSQAALVSEIKNGYQQISREFASAQRSSNSHVEADLKRIADGIALLQNNQSVHPDYVDQMQSELNNLHVGLNQLINNPPTQVDLSGVSNSIETGYSEIVNKLDQVLSSRGNEMPQIDIPDYTNQFSSLQNRMEEITRAVVSMTVSPNNSQDQHSFERIEARLASLSKSVDDILHNASAAPVVGPAIDSGLGDTIAAQIAQLSDKLDNVGIMGDVSSNIFADVQGIASRLDSLQNEIGVLASSLDQSVGEQSGAVRFQSSDLELPQLGEIEQRLAELANRIDGLSSLPGDNPNTSSQEILQTLRQLVGRVENIEQIALQEGAQVSAFDGPDRIGGLEQQLNAIAAQLGSFAPGEQHSMTDLTPITERLDHIEGQIASSRDIVIDLAAEAAQKAARQSAETNGGSGDHENAYNAILEELRMLRDGQNHVSQSGQNDSQLNEISTSINAIAQRLAQIESAGFAQESSPADQMPQSAYSQDTYGQDTGEAFEEQYETAPAMHTYAEATEGAAASFEDFSTTEPAIEPAYSEHSYVEPMAQVHEAPSMDVAEDMSSLDAAMDRNGPATPEAVEGDDVPLEPGSGMPDLEALVRNATQRKKDKTTLEKQTAEEDGSTSDLLAAARRAAQMASQQANAINEKPAKKAIKKPSLPSFKAPAFVNKKVLMMSAAVVAIAIGGFTLAPKLFNSGSTNDQTESALAIPSSLAEENMTTENAVDSTAGDAADLADNGARMVDGTTTSANSSALLSPDPISGQPATGADKTDDMVSASLEASQPIDETELSSQPDIEIGDIPGEIGNQSLRAAVAGGDGDALFEVARRYTDGDGVERNLEEAIVWYQKAAETGHAPAQYRLGNFYEKGHGVTADPAEAAKWYSKAAAQGNALAMHNLAVLNAMGVATGEPDMTTAVGWFEKAADMGVKDSQVNLGILYTKGMGVEENLERAYKWFAVAAKGGDNDAVKKRDTVAQAMRPEQLEKARGEAELWKPVKLQSEANVARVDESWKSVSTTKTGTLTKADIIKQTQIMLAKAGFDAGTPDGQMGNKTRSAILGFQKKMGMTADGQISQQLLEALSKVSI